MIRRQEAFRLHPQGDSQKQGMLPATVEVLGVGAEAEAVFTVLKIEVQWTNVSCFPLTNRPKCSATMDVPATQTRANSAPTPFPYWVPVGIGEMCPHWEI